MDDSSTLIPSLPNDIAMLCLASLPLHMRAMACCVSRAWRNALNSKSIVASVRLSLNLPPEHWVFIGLFETECDPGYLQATEENTQWLLLDPLSLRALVLPNPLQGISVADIRLQSAATCGKIFLSEIPVFRNLMNGFRFYDVHEKEGWNSVPSPPRVNGQQRRCFAYAQSKEFVYMSGGLMDETRNASRSVCRYNTGTNQWEALPDMIMPRINCACVVLKGKIYAIGGYNSFAGSTETHASGEFFDPETWEWKLVPNLCANGLRYAEESNVDEPAVAVVEKKLYAMQSHSNEVMEFDPVKDRWVHFGYGGVDYEIRSCSLRYKLLGVGSELWVFQYSIGEYVSIYFCLPGRHPRESRGVMWRQINVGAIEQFDYILTCTVLTEEGREWCTGFGEIKRKIDDLKSKTGTVE